MNAPTRLATAGSRHATSMSRAEATLAGPAPAWEFDQTGLITRSNAACLWLWDCSPVIARPPVLGDLNAFAVMLRNAPRVPAGMNQAFWSAQFSLLRGTRRESTSVDLDTHLLNPSLAKLWDESAKRTGDEETWAYPLRMAPLSSMTARRTLDLTTSVASTRARDGSVRYIVVFEPDILSPTYDELHAMLEERRASSGTRKSYHVIARKEAVSATPIEQINIKERVVSTDAPALSDSGKAIVNAAVRAVTTSGQQLLLRQFREVYHYRSGIDWTTEGIAAHNSENRDPLTSSLAQILAAHVPSSLGGDGDKSWDSVSHDYSRDAWAGRLEMAAAGLPNCQPELDVFAAKLGAVGVEATPENEPALEQFVMQAISQYVSRRESGTDSSDPW